MDVLFEGTIFVDYGQAALYDAETDDPDVGRAFVGQTNGLLGTATPGLAWIHHATHTGDVAYRIELHDDEPVLDDEWEDVVEAPYVVRAAPVDLVPLMDDAVASFEVEPGDYRARFSSRGRDAAREALETGEDAYLLQLWPAPPMPDRVVRETSRDAAYWNRVGSECLDQIRNCRTAKPGKMLNRLPPGTTIRNVIKAGEDLFWGFKIAVIR